MTSDGMIAFAFLLVWAVALGFDSAAALAVAPSSHAYIWIHSFDTESPGMDFLDADGHV